MKRIRRNLLTSSENVKTSKKNTARSRKISKHAKQNRQNSHSGISERRHSRSKKKKQNLLSKSSNASDEDLEINDRLFGSIDLQASKLMSKYENRLRGGHFRFLNQSLYLSTGNESWKRFKSNASLFREYHQGYQQSMQHWSVQPVDVAIRWLQKQRPHQKVVDYGCGDAKIMKADLTHDVTSLDLVALDPRVIACDMAHSPIEPASQDIAVFSLSLMSTDYHECLKDAARVLKLQGVLWIAEVCSRFATPSGKEDYHTFIDALEKLGFVRLLAKRPSPLFVVLIFKKAKDVNTKTRIDWPVLKPCLYKKR